VKDQYSEFKRGRTLSAVQAPVLLPIRRCQNPVHSKINMFPIVNRCISLLHLLSCGKNIFLPELIMTHEMVIFKIASEIYYSFVVFDSVAKVSISRLAGLKSTC
jgi:hypothetical protein